MNRNLACMVLFCVTVLVMQLTAMATPISIPTVFVGNAGNTGEAQPLGTFGAVPYDYRIGTTEVTVGQYTSFLNAVAATDTYSLYNTNMATDLNIAGIARAGVSGTYTYSVIGSPNKPITYVSWLDAARFTNWLHNNQPTGMQNASTTESGAYSLNGANSNSAAESISRNVDAQWFIPSDNEWYKAAFHKNDGITGNYWNYATKTDEVPYSSNPPGTAAPTPSNTANYHNTDQLPNGYNDGYAATGLDIVVASQNYLTDVDAYTESTSPYGTFGQGGNAAEWVEDRYDRTHRAQWGGSWRSGAFFLQSSVRSANFAGGQAETVGFRVATITVPEPASIVMGLMGAAALGAVLVRKRRVRERDSS